MSGGSALPTLSAALWVMWSSQPHSSQAWQQLVEVKGKGKAELGLHLISMAYLAV